MALSLSSTVRLNNGMEMPWLGLGTFRMPEGETTRRAVRYALEVGYRSLDTASAYGNEEDIGAALAASGLDRRAVFLTTKVWVDEQGYEETLAACAQSLARLGTDYLDLYLIHWPAPGRWQESWRAMETLLARGTCRAIGVSNFQLHHLETLRAHSATLPAVNQVEFSPFWYRKELLDYCLQHDIRLEAYSSLVRGQKWHHPVLRALAEQYGKSPAQLLIRWTLQHQVIAIPKSTNPAHLRENADVFDFTIAPKDMTALDGLNENYSIVNAGWRAQFE